jgi:hypothetical protein
MTIEQRERELTDWLGVMTLVYFDRHQFRVAGKVLHCPGLQIGGRRIDKIEFSTPALAARAMDFMAAQVVIRLLEERAAEVGGTITTGRSARHDRHARLQQARWLRGHKPNTVFPADIYNEMLRAAGVRDPRKKYTRILRNADGAIMARRQTDESI